MRKSLDRRQTLAQALGLVAAALGAPAVQAQLAPLRFAVSDSWAPPYVLREGTEPVAGLLVELMQAIAQAAGARPLFVRLPSQRVDAALREGEVDLHVLISPDWYGPEGPPGRLGPPMVVLEDVLVTRDAGGPVDLAARRGLRVGTVLGYRYDTLQPAFASGALVREDAPSQARMLEKLRLGRSDAAVCDRRVMQHFNRSLPPAQRLHARQRVAQTITHPCLSPKAAWPHKALMEALDRVVSQGVLRRLLADLD
jgi:polar amino acid transport system substrate-binding protein